MLYAATYQRRRATWGFNGGGPGSAMYKSSDAGRTWTKLTSGVPPGPLGRIGMDVYRANPNIVYARIEHEKESGTYRSDDAGLTWRKMSNVNPRPMYFSQIRIDPTNDLRIYVLGVQIHISDDGGKTFIENGALHSDHHAMWINPNNSNHIIDGNDGGIGISWDKGKTWEGIYNMDLGQFYHVTYDMETPYNVCGGLQDNYTWCGPSAVRSRTGIANDEWFQIQGGDGFEAQIDPNDSRIIYAESQDGNIVARRPRHQRAQVDPPAAGARRSRRCAGTGTRRSCMSPHDSGDHLRRREQGVQVHRSRPVVDGDQPRPHRERPIAKTLSLMGVTAKEFTIAKNDGVQSYGNLVQLVESPKQAGRALRRHRRRQGPHDAGRRQDLDRHHRQVPERAEERVCLAARRPRRTTSTPSTPPSTTTRNDDYGHLRLRQRRRRQQLPLDRRGHSEGPGRDDDGGGSEEPERALLRAPSSGCS